MPDESTPLHAERADQAGLPGTDPSGFAHGDEIAADGDGAGAQVSAAHLVDEVLGDPDDAQVATAASQALARARTSAQERGFRPSAPGVRRKRSKAPAPVQLEANGRDPLFVGDAIARIIAERGWEVDVAAGTVMERWGQLVGPQIADHASPVTFADGVLTVRAESTAWATQLTLLQGSILTAIREGVGSDVVTELIIKGPAAPSWSKGPRRSRGPGPRDTYG